MVSACSDLELGPVPQPILVLGAQKAPASLGCRLGLPGLVNKGHGPRRGRFVFLWLEFLQPALCQMCCLTSGIQP